mgnify:CR=1 FL=1
MTLDLGSFITKFAKPILDPGDEAAERVGKLALLDGHFAGLEFGVRVLQDDALHVALVIGFGQVLEVSMPRRKAIATAWVRSRAPNLARTARMCAFTVSSDTSPNDVWTADLASGQARRLLHRRA